MFATIAFAQQPATPPPGGPLSSLLPLLLMILIFWFLLIRPQMKKTKEHKAMLEALQVGDRVVTNGGIHGEIKAIQPDVVTLQVDEKVRLKIDRSAVARKLGAASAS